MPVDDTGGDETSGQDGATEESESESEEEGSETMGVDDLPPPDLPPEPECGPTVVVGDSEYFVDASTSVEGAILAVVAEPSRDVRNPRAGVLTLDGLFVLEYDPELSELNLVAEVDFDVEGVVVDEGVRMDAADVSNDGLLDFVISSPGEAAWYLESDADGFTVVDVMHPQEGVVGGVALSGIRGYLSTTDPLVSVFENPPQYSHSAAVPVHSDWWIGSELGASFGVAYFAAGTDLYGVVTVVTNTGIYGPIDLGAPIVALERSALDEGVYAKANDIIAHVEIDQDLVGTSAAFPGGLEAFAALLEPEEQAERFIGQVESGAWVSGRFPELGDVDVSNVLCTADVPLGVESSFSSEAGPIGFVLESDGAIEVVRRQPRCGDTIVTPWAGEECDDGNDQEGDGCSAACTIE